MSSHPPLEVGDPAPWFCATDGGNPGPVAFDELAGSFILLLFFETAARPDIAAALSALDPPGEMFDGRRALFLGVTRDPDDFARARLPRREGRTYLLDAGGGAAARYGVARPTAFLLSPALQILDIIAFDTAEAFLRQSSQALGEALAAPRGDPGAPILFVPRIFDHAFCRRLIGLYDANGGRELGLIENKGQIVQRADAAYRQRLDHFLSDEDALQTCRALLERRLLPLVYRAFQFATTRIERYLVGCYDANSGGYFRAHRDNTAPPVAHRRFALTIPLNDDFEGGHLRFPEFGDRLHAPGAGDAVVFSCSLLHEVMPVTAGRRYAFISFLYDEQGQRMREAYAKGAAKT